MRHPIMTVLMSALALIVMFPKLSAAEMLISESEAKLPPPSDTNMATRGITRGPGIELISPAPGTENIKSPLPLRIKFIARNSIAIDPASVKLTYLRVPMVDLTERIKPHVTKDGIDMEQAGVPPGNHLIRLDLKDIEGRTATAMITLSVAPK